MGQQVERTALEDITEGRSKSVNIIKGGNEKGRRWQGD